jgi:hypothetical protein
MAKSPTPPPDDDPDWDPDGPLGPDDDPGFSGEKDTDPAIDDIFRLMAGKGPELAHVLRGLEAAGHQWITDEDKATLERLRQAFGGRRFTPREANERVAADPQSLLRLARYNLVEVLHYRLPGGGGGNGGGNGKPPHEWRLREFVKAAWRSFRAAAYVRVDAQTRERPVRAPRRFHMLRDSLLVRGLA